MFPTCSEILEVIRSLGYVKPVAGLPVTPDVVKDLSEVQGEPLETDETATTDVPSVG
jgi:hypothetical protein